MRRIALISAMVAGGLIVLAFGAILIVPQLIPSDVYRERIQTAASNALGREVAVTGDVKLRVFPRIEARAGATTISNPEAFGDAPFASMGELRAAVKLIPLLFQRVEVDEFVLVEPNIALVALEDGTNNWTFVSTRAPSQSQTGSGSPLSASLGDVRIVEGTVSYEDRATGQAHALSELNMRARMEAMDRPFDIEASGIADQLPFELSADIRNPQAMLGGQPSDLSGVLKTEMITADVDGTMSLGETPQFDFAFTGEVPSVTELASAFEVVGLPPATVLGAVKATGRATGTPDNIRLAIESARHTSPLINADLTGDVTLTETIGFVLEAAADIPRLSDLAQAMNIEAPAGSALGRATASASVSGSPGDIRFENVALNHDSDLLKLTYDGAARLTDALTYNGRLSLAAPDLKRLASAAGAKLPDGDIYKSFSLTGDTSGSATDVMLRNAVVEFDQIRGAGQAALDFSGKPRLTGGLTTGPIDITPYASASGAPKSQGGGSKGWGSAPIDLTPLKLVDAKITLNADSLKFRRFDFGPSRMQVDLRDGLLNANVDQTTLFGGVGALQLVADGSGAVPVVGLKANMDGLAVKPLLQAAANFGLMEGTGDLSLDVTGTGANLSAFMSSLQGQGGLAFDEGLLNGVDLNALAASAKTALTSKSVPVSAFGQNATTAFRNLNANFSMQDGVAAIADLKLQSGDIAVSGGGSLDIGDQSLSFTLFPQFANTSSGVNGYGLPVKFAGDWNGVRASLDFDWLIQRAQADVKTRVQDEIQNELRKSLGDDFTNLFGNRTSIPRSPGPASQSPTPSSPPEPEAQSPSEAPAEDLPASSPVEEANEPPPSTEDILRREAGRALGDLLRGDRN